MAVPFDEYQKKRNSEFYKAKGAGFEKEFKTFAYDARFAEALAKDFYKRFSGSEKETLDVYEFGIGDGSLGIRFLMELRKIGHRLVEKTVYRFCDFSDELVKHAVKRADAFGFNADGIVYDAIEEPKFLRDANYVLANELYDDLPAKLLVREDNKIMEIFVEDDKKELVPFEGDDELVQYMMEMPEKYWIPLNVSAKNHLSYCSKGLAPGGYIDIFDYGFRPEEIKEMPAEMWNNSIIREFEWQITTDVNFDFISKGLNAHVETQLEFVERALGAKFHEVEGDKLRYLTDEEMKGKEADFEEDRGYLHLRLG